MDLRAFGDRSKHEFPRVLCSVRDLDLEATIDERSCGSFKMGAVGWALELEIRRAGVWESERHARGSSRSGFR